MRPAILAALLLALGWWLHLEHVDPRYQGRRTSEWLLELNNLWEDEMKVAENAISTLGERAIPQITKSFYATEPQWKTDFCDWIEAKTKWKIERQDVKSLRKSAHKAIDLLGERAASMAPTLIDSLGNDEFHGDSLEALGVIGEPVVPALMVALNHKSSRVRVEVVRLLSLLEQSDVVPQLKEFTRHEDPELRAVSIEALAALKLSASEVLPLLRPLLKETHEGVRACAVNVLGCLAQASPGLIPEFAAFIKDPSVLVRKRVTEWLGQFCVRDKAALDALLIALADSEAGVRACAVAGICAQVGVLPNAPSPIGYESPYDSWGLSHGLPVSEYEPNPEPLFSRSTEILPLLVSHLKIVSSLPNYEFDPELALSQTCFAMVLVDPRFRASFRSILDEIKAKSKFTNDPFFEGLKRISAKSDLPDDSWHVISLHLSSINEIDPQTAKLVYERVLKMHTPPVWLSQFSVP